ncbi:MAG: hypothetical protein JXA07_15390 [Spirochaetes bacterium]|nr:hypothetical protein [Spirochaetota bacterium]
MEKVLNIWIAALFVLLLALTGCGTRPFTESRKVPVAFCESADMKGWTMNLKDYALSVKSGERTFALRVQDGCFLRFSGHGPEKARNSEFGPLQKEYGPLLSKLLDAALVFGARQRSGNFTLDVKWELYARSITKWAQKWKASDLVKQKKNLNTRKNYCRLVDMISRSVREDMKPVLEELGFTATGVDMEKMSFQKASWFKYYKQVLAPEGIAPDQEIPVPLMLYLKVIAEPETIPARPLTGAAVDSIFCSARKDDTTLYVSYQSVLDEYEISGSHKEKDGTYASFAPLSDPGYISESARFLRAALNATGAASQPEISLRLNVHMYPKLESELTERFTLSTEVMQKTAMPRIELSNTPFFSYKPLPGTGFVDSIQPLLKACGYTFHSLQVSVSNEMRAGEHPEYKARYKIAGLKPHDRLWTPDIVYVIAGKSRAE